MRSRAAAVDAVRETWTFAPRVHGLVRELAACQGTARAGIPSLDIGSQSDVAYLTGEFSREAGTGHVSAASLPYPAFLRLREESRTLTDLLASGRLGDVAVNVDGQTELVDVDDRSPRLAQIVPARGTLRRTP